MSRTSKTLIGRRSLKSSSRAGYRSSNRRIAYSRHGPRRARVASANAKASRALMLIKKFKKNLEVKIDANAAETMQIPIAGNWILEGFGPYMVTGTTEVHRIGRQITVKNLAMRYLIKLTAVEATGTAVRICILYDRKPSGANATTANIFKTDNQLLSHYNPDQEYRGRFQILMDKTITFGDNQLMRAGKAFFKGPMVVKYNATNAGDVTDMEYGNFIICAMAEGNAAAINVDYGFIFRFTDD